ncbi:hypothetical protein BDV24DRAFT_161060 [Aspergillus arachidicola]|uniref:Uncharacterized protein n=1 Tax=Aspergillus arachidicola TaxID=656916 RepID=A0A5N6YE57_9EURO|nr:hypothetical protein BDV24DRAFT_161060 [Aspergillus arachidicola]
MKLHLAFLSAFASLAAAAVAGNSQAPPFTEEPGGVEKRNHFEDLLPAEVDDPRPEAHDFSKGCDRPCEEQDKAHGLDNPSTPPEKRDDVKDPTLSEKPLVSVADSRKTFIPTPDDFPPDFRPVVKWSPDCRKTCEKDDDCCR